ncbi:Nitric oxide reductase activation protein NorD [hydrothermal vent metagenome]|uniref:Nitric oxide reductase activation protein NorD n=1 Tax=hydrothermal vent metagenome TaxID=652676 RepID=A0A3B0ZJ69_9ZZZZ
MTIKAPFTSEEILKCLDIYLDVEFTFYHNEKHADVLAALPLTQQQYILAWVQRTASTHHELGYQFMAYIVDILNEMDAKTIEAWALHAMDTYDVKGLYPALEVIRNVNNFLQLSHEKEAGAVLEDESAVLLHFMHGLSGRKLKLEEAEQVYTDTETIFLPALVASLENKKENFKLYKVMVAYCWAQSRFGTYRINLFQEVESAEYPEKFIALFHAVETLRLEHCLARELPGLYRQLCGIKSQLDNPDLDKQWQAISEQLQAETCTVKDTLNIVHQYLNKLEPFTPYCYQGLLQPEITAGVMQARMDKEKKQLKNILRKMQDDLNEGKELEPLQNNQSKAKFELKDIKEQSSQQDFTMELTLDDQPIAPPDNAKNLMSSILQDLGDIPDEYLVAAGDGEYDPSFFEEKEEDPDDVWKGPYHEEGAFLYNEWDFKRQNYRKNWCAVREKVVKPIYDNFVNNTMKKHGKLIKHLRKTFEAMRDDNKLLKRQTNGDEIDIDAYVEALADAKDGSEMTDRLYMQMQRHERNIAVCFMVDMSGSTKGWINDAEREALVLLCESLESLGDRYAIYGFSGLARKRCEIYTIKEFDDIYDEEVKARISGIEPKDYTRMGFAIRHLNKKLLDIEAKTRILITISDGKPDDYDSYRGEYGIEDTRRALVETRREGIHPYCITIDSEAKDYLPHMYGAAAYTVIDEIRELPLKVSDIYRRLTT